MYIFANVIVLAAAQDFSSAGFDYLFQNKLSGIVSSMVGTLLLALDFQASGNF